VLHDAGYVGFREPFGALFTQGMICKRSDKDGQLYKMSKSKGNVVSPDALIKRYGADTLRLYTLFIGPPEKDAEWNDAGIEGAFRFLRRLWRRVFDSLAVLQSARGLACNLEAMAAPERDLYRKLHETIDSVTRDMEGDFHFNSAIARIMELLNAIDACVPVAGGTDQHRAVFRQSIESLVLLLSPFAPHMAEELWECLGHPPSIMCVSWPRVDAAALTRSEVEVVIQINGKLRDRLRVPAGLPAKELEQRALASEATARHLKGLAVQKVIVIPDKLVNVAAR